DRGQAQVGEAPVLHREGTRRERHAHARSSRPLYRPQRGRAVPEAAPGPRPEGKQDHRPVVSWLDLAVLGVLLLSVAWGIWRGLIRELFAILGWIIAFLAANLLAGPLAAEMPAAIQRPEMRLVAAFVAVFVGVLFVTALIGLLLSKIVSAVGLLVF